MPKLKSNEEFVQEVKIKFPNVILLEKYVNSSVAIQCTCTKCNYKWKVRPASLLVSTRLS